MLRVQGTNASYEVTSRRGPEVDDKIAAFNALFDGLLDYDDFAGQFEIFGLSFYPCHPFF